MRKFKVLYSDKTFSDRSEKFETSEYDRITAQSVADGLALMGCSDFEFVPVSDRPQVVQDREAA